jgi:hypothetical protein
VARFLKNHKKLRETAMIVALTKKGEFARILPRVFKGDVVEE